MTDKSERNKNTTWTDEHWIVLMEVIASRKVVPTGRHWDEITAEHNRRTGLKRGKRAVQAAFNRLRDALHFAENKKLWEIIVSNRSLFELCPPGQYPRKKKPKKPKINKRVDLLEAQIAEVADNVSLILENLTKGV